MAVMIVENVDDRPRHRGMLAVAYPWPSGSPHIGIIYAGQKCPRRVPIGIASRIYRQRADLMLMAAAIGNLSDYRLARDLDATLAGYQDRTDLARAHNLTDADPCPTCRRLVQLHRPGQLAACLKEQP